MINDMKTLESGKRLRELRKYFNMTQIDFAKRLKLSNGHISDMEKGRKNITDPVIRLIALEFNVNEEWLRTGNGNMLNTQSEDEELAYLLGKILASHNDFVKHTMLSLARLSPEEWTLVENIIKSIKKDTQP